MEAFVMLILILVVAALICVAVWGLFGLIIGSFSSGSGSGSGSTSSSDSPSYSDPNNSAKRQAEYTAKAIKNGGELSVIDEIMTDIKFHD